ncbi:MAG: outer membrane protein [Candidatus Omnitrophota bacterium]|jgi:outer membrane protein
MKYLFNLLMPIVASAILLQPAMAADTTVVFVDLDKAFNEYYKTKLADSQLKEQAEEFNSERKKLVEVYESLQEAFNKLREDSANPGLKEDARTELRNQAEEKLIELRDQEQKIRRFDETRRKQLEDQGRRMRKRIVDEIKEKVQTFARNQGYAAVIDISGQSLNGVEIVIYVDKKVDVTPSILELLNKGRE